MIESSDTNGGIDLHVLDTQENRDSDFDEKPVDNRRDFLKIHVSFNQYGAESPLKSGPNQDSLEVPNTRRWTQKQVFSTGKTLSNQVATKVRDYAKSAFWFVERTRIIQKSEIPNTKQ